MAGEAPTSQEYIQHHLTNLAYGKHPDGSWGFAGSPEEITDMGFWAIHVDTMIWSIGLGIIFLALFTNVCFAILLILLIADFVFAISAGV